MPLMTRDPKPRGTAQAPRLPVRLPETSARLALALSLNAMLLLAWLALYRPVLDYLRVIYGREDFATNRWVLLGAGALIARQMWRGDIRPTPTHPPTFTGRGLPLAVALGASLAYLAAERWLDVNTLSALLFGIASYGLLGLWLAPRRWRQGWPAALLLAGALPINEHMQTFVGYPARILTARVVAAGLASAGAGVVDVGDILVLENGLAKVDLPCSGVRSLWSGGLFLLAATWIERKRLGGRWWLLAAALTIGLVLANTARVGALVLVGEMWQRSLLASMLHVPLGVLGFGAACALAWRVLLRLPDVADDAWEGEGATGHTGDEAKRSPRRSYGQAPKLIPRAHLALVVAVAAMALAWQPRPAGAVVHAAPVAWAWPAGMTVAPLPLDPVEAEWFERDGADVVTRVRFTWAGSGDPIGGSMILVESRTWRAHHRPERCFEVYGLRLAASSPHLVEGDFPVRWVRLGHPEKPGAPTLSAGYWFQSATGLTADYGRRIWDDLRWTRRRWLLVSILFDQPAEAGDPAVEGLLKALRETADARLQAAPGAARASPHARGAVEVLLGQGEGS